MNSAFGKKYFSLCHNIEFSAIWIDEVIVLCIKVYIPNIFNLIDLEP